MGILCQGAGSQLPGGGLPAEDAGAGSAPAGEGGRDPAAAGAPAMASLALSRIIHPPPSGHPPGLPQGDFFSLSCDGFSVVVKLLLFDCGNELLCMPSTGASWVHPWVQHR